MITGQGAPVVLTAQQIEDKVFEVLCQHDVSIMNKGIPTPSTYISNALRITLYQARKALRSLSAKGLIHSYRCSVWDEMSECSYIASGYRLTDAGKATEQYKIAKEYENKIADEIWNTTGVNDNGEV